MGGDFCPEVSYDATDEQLSGLPLVRQYDYRLNGPFNFGKMLIGHPWLSPRPRAQTLSMVARSRQAGRFSATADCSGSEPVPFFDGLADSPAHKACGIGNLDLPGRLRFRCSMDR